MDTAKINNEVEESELSFEYRLYKKIEPIRERTGKRQKGKKERIRIAGIGKEIEYEFNTHIFETKYAFHFESLRMDGEGNVMENTVFDDLFYHTVFTAKELGLDIENIDKFNSRKLTLLKKNNTSEYQRVYSGLVRLKKEQNKFRSSETLKKIIEYHEEIAGRFILWFETNGFTVPTTKKKKEDKIPIQKTNNLIREKELANNELANAHKIITTLQKKNKFPESPDSSKLQELADSTRKKNGKINYTAIARKLGRHHATIANWCKFHSVH